VHLTSQVLSVSSLIGFVTVTGFTIRNGILLLNRYQERIAEGATLDEAIIEGSAERMVPILMTSLTTVLGLIPIMIAADKPGGELLAPLAVVQFGGILGAMFLGLIILPAAARLALRGVALRQSTVAVLLVGLGLSVSGCQSYTAHPIDWEAEAAAWQGASGEVELRSCEEAALLAVIGNPELNQRRLQAAGSRRVAAETGWWEDPELDLDISRALKSAEHPFMVGTALTFTLPLSGVPALEARVAEGYAEADALDVIAAERTIAAEARVAYHAYQVAVLKRNVLKTALEDVDYLKALKSVESLVSFGEVSYATLMELQQMHYARGVALREAEQTVLEAWIAIQRVLGLAPGVKGIVSGVPGMCTHCPKSVPEALALTSHVQVKAQLARLGADEVALQAEIRRQYPDLKVGPSFEREEGMNKAGLVLGVELPLWNRNRQAIAEATATREASRGSAIVTWRTLATEAAAAQDQLETLIARQPHVPRRDRQALKQLYAVGELEPVDFLVALEGNLEVCLASIEWEQQCILAAAALNQFQLN
jgi:outer membrane protein TolC